MLLGRKAMSNLDSILKSRDITLPAKVCLVKPMVFAVVMYGYESWTLKKAEHWRIDAFELWCWRKLLRIPWTARRSNQCILKKSVLNIHWKEWCWILWPILWPLDVKSWLIWKDQCWERLKAGGGDDKGWGGWMASPTQWTWVWVDSGSWWWTGRPGILQSVGSWRGRHYWVTELNWVQWRNLSFLTVLFSSLPNPTSIFHYPLSLANFKVYWIHPMFFFTLLPLSGFWLLLNLSLGHSHIFCITYLL